MSIFNSIPVSKKVRSGFNLSHELKTTTNMGNLECVLCQEVLPSDHFRLKVEALTRFAPMLAPIMHRVDVKFEAFFVPTRLVWDDWKDFITGGTDGLDTPAFPTITAKTIRDCFRNLGISSAEFNKQFLGKGTLWNQMGLPPMTVDSFPADESLHNVRINALPFRCYNLIYNEYYRDETLNPDFPDYVHTSGGDISSSEFLYYHTQQRAWSKDYFTSALPWTQRGPQATIPVADKAEVKLVDNLTQDNPAFGMNNFIGINNPAAAHGDTVMSGTRVANINSTSRIRLTDTKWSGATGSWVYDPRGTLLADLSEATGITINQLRYAVHLQRFLENNARGGARYIEQLLSHFGVRSSDARLQRPQLLGRSSSPVVISEVLQTSSTDASSPQANMAGHGVAAESSYLINNFFEEHGYILVFMSVMPKATYQQGVPRMFFKDSKFDFAWPEFAQLGEQEIKLGELYYRGNARSDTPANNNDTVFGYTPRYAEYKTRLSRVAGDFVDTLNYWHLGRIFNAPPRLNNEFVLADPSTRIFAVTDKSVSHVYSQIYFDLKAVRPLPKYGVPSL